MSSSRVILGLSHHIELELFDLFTFQLDRELITYNVTVEDLKKRIGEVFQKGGELLEAMAELRYEKANLEVRLLSWLEKLQKVWEKVSSAHSEISLLREQIDKGRVEKLELKCESGYRRIT